jgi:type II secretory pathway pseudopilin PulG
MGSCFLEHSRLFLRNISSRKAIFGFALGELLISVAILGLITIYTIPKILNAQENLKKKAVFKETIAAVQVGVYDQVRQGNLTLGVSKCGIADSTAQRSLSETFLNHTSINVSSNKLYLTNGASIGHHTGAHLDYHIDWNGDELPNTTGDDLLILIFRCSSTNSGRFITNSAAGATLYDDIFE